MGPFLIVILVLAALSGVLMWRRAQGRIAASRAATSKDPTAPVEVLAPETLGATLHRLSGSIESFADRCAHPRDLGECPEFVEAVKRLADPAAPLDVLRQYALGSNSGLACAAFEALCARPDRQALALGVTNQFRGLGPGAIHFALRYLDSLEERPPVGAAVAFAYEWWGNYGGLTESFRESFQAREAKGDLPEFGGALDTPGVSAASEIESFLERVDHPFAHALRAQLKHWSGSRIDEGFLNGFGRFWGPGSGAPGSGDDVLVEPEPWKDMLRLAHKGVLATPPRSVLVSGEPRIGKSAFLRLIGQRLVKDGWRVFEAGGPELMAGQMYFGQLEGRIRQIVAELDASKRVAWCVGDIAQLAESGRHPGQAASVLDQILPAVTTGRLVILSEASPEGVSRLLQGRPSLRTQMEIYRLEPFSEEGLATLAGRIAARLNGLGGPTILPEATQAALQFSHQYFSVTPLPGVVADVLKRSRQQAVSANEKRVTPATVIAALSQITGLPQAILDDKERVDLNAVRQFFGDRVIGQDEAVATVVDRIAMLKAGLVDPGRPVGVFLFAGPTGTGKTELAKTLAEYLFGSAARMARLDMSEFQSSDSTVKILGERGRAETDALVDRIRKQPFSVVLLDEFEKAHANVWDLFLQVFDDGRLTDANGYAVDFRHTIIILTSNLGATSHRSAGIGFIRSKDAYADEQVLNAVGRTFRPEFINRLDKIVVFKPLSRELMGAILRKELAEVLERRGLRNRDWAVEWEPSALDFLLDRGFSPEMGARPLKRAIDQHLLAPLAATLVEHRFPEGDQFLFVRSNGKAIEVEFVDPDGRTEPAASAATSQAKPEESGPPSLAGMILQPAGSVLEEQGLSTLWAGIEAAMTGAEMAELKAGLAAELSAPDIWSRPERHALFSRLALADRLQEAARTADRLEARLASGRGDDGRPSREMVSRLAQQLYLLEQGLEDLRAATPVDVVLAVEPALDGGADPVAAAAWRERLEVMYRLWAERRRMQVDDLEPPAGKPGAKLLRVTGFGACRTLLEEAGLHVLEAPDSRAAKRTVARVRVAPGPSEEPIPARLYAALAGALAAAEEASAVVRRYREAPSPLVRDHTGWRSGKLDAVLGGDFDLIGEAARKDG